MYDPETKPHLPGDVGTDTDTPYMDDFGPNPLPHPEDEQP